MAKKAVADLAEAGRNSRGALFVIRRPAFGIGALGATPPPALGGRGHCAD